MAKKRRRRRAKTTLPILQIAPLVTHGVRFVEQTMRVGPERAIGNLVASFTGYSPVNEDFIPNRLKKTYTPILIGYAGHKLANILGINRALARARVPYLRL